MSLFRFFRSKAAAQNTAKTAAAKRKVRPRFEQLESREVPANDIFTVTGTAGSQVTLTFDWHSRQSAFWDEIGVYTVNDAQGRVGNVLPGDPGYAQAALLAGQTIFEAGEFEGAHVERAFTAGTQLGFYLIQNNTRQAVLSGNPQNFNITSKQAFFSVDVANRDKLDHVLRRDFGDRSVRLLWEDQYGGGDRDYNDAVINVGFRDQDTSQARGVAGQPVPTRFKYQRASTGFRNEMGFFRVDDATGRIGALSPGNEGYAEAALDPSRRTTVFKRSANPGATRVRNLPGGGFFGLYLVQNGSANQVLNRNPDNIIGGGPIAFFSFAAANPDGFDHIRWLSATRFAFEDQTNGGDRDFNDFVGTFNMVKPANTAPFVKTPIAPVTVAQGAADRFIDLAGHFDDLDLANSRVRINTNRGAVDVELFDRQAPKTVANFYNYITDGDYDNTIFHRSADLPGGVPFVLQGGGFEFDPLPQSNLDPVATDPPVDNEFSAQRSNVRGTLAMAKTGNNPNSATSQFFFNLGNNSANLDSQNGGFTVYGRVAEGDMGLVDQLGAIPTQDHGAPFDEIPLVGYNGNNFPTDTTRDNYIVINNVAIVNRPEFLSYAVTGNTDPTVVTATIEHNRVKLVFGIPGTSTVTVLARDSVGHTRETSFTVTVNP
jgi:cyclophilin family peptidyl-prolyl cis-trans isomerase